MLCNYLYYFVFFTFHIKIVTLFSLAKSEIDNNGDFMSVKETNVTLNSADEINSPGNSNNTIIRTKRQSGGAGKFTDAAKMPQVKLMRLFTQMVKNLWAPAYVGGAHPLHPEVPKVVVALYMQKILEFFVPEVGQDPDKAMG